MRVPGDTDEVCVWHEVFLKKNVGIVKEKSGPMADLLSGMSAGTVLNCLLITV